MLKKDMKKLLLAFFGVLIITFLIKPQAIQAQAQDSCSVRLEHDREELYKLNSAIKGGISWEISDLVSNWIGITLTEDGCSVKNIELQDKDLSSAIGYTPFPDINLPKYRTQ